jgi:hypothetical protein
VVVASQPGSAAGSRSASAGACLRVRGKYEVFGTDPEDGGLPLLHIGATFPLTEAAAVLRLVAAGKAIGKVVLEVEPLHPDAAGHRHKDEGGINGSNRFTGVLGGEHERVAG